MISSALSIIVWLYLAGGGIMAVVLLAGGFERLLPTPATITRPARLLLLPGAILLWPLLLRRGRAKAARSRP